MRGWSPYVPKMLAQFANPGRVPSFRAAAPATATGASPRGTSAILDDGRHHTAIIYIAILHQKRASGDLEREQRDLADLPCRRFDKNYSASHMRELGAKMAQYIIKGSAWEPQLAPVSGAGLHRNDSAADPRDSTARSGCSV